MASELKELVAVLEQTISTDREALSLANKYLEEAAAGNLSDFLRALSAVLFDSANSTVARLAAALQIKNSLTSNDEEIKYQKQQIWLQLPDETCEPIKDTVLAALGTKQTRPYAAAQCVAAVAVVELPIMRWEALIPTLAKNVVNEGSSRLLRKSTLKAIDYICQDMQCNVMENQLEEMLMDHVLGMRRAEPSEYVRLAAIDQTHETLRPLVDAFLKNLKAHPVATNVCWVFLGLFQAAHNASPTGDTVALSPYFELIVTKLLETTDCPYLGQDNLRCAAQVALVKMNQHSSPNSFSMVCRTADAIFERVNHLTMIESDMSDRDRRKLSQLHSLLCHTLHILLRQVPEEEENAPLMCNFVANALLAVLSSPAGASAGVKQDVFPVVFKLVDLLGAQFAMCMPNYKCFLVDGLGKYLDGRVCSATAQLTVEICKALREQMVPYCDEIVSVMISSLAQPRVHRCAKLRLVSAFGDMAIAIGSPFVNYADRVLDVLRDACDLLEDPDSLDMEEYDFALGECVLEAYTGIIRGLKGRGQTAPRHVLLLVEHHLEHIVQLINRIAHDGKVCESMIALTADLISDLCTCFGSGSLSCLETLLDIEAITRLLAQGQRSEDLFTKSLCTWATTAIQKLKNSQGGSMQ